MSITTSCPYKPDPALRHLTVRKKHLTQMQPVLGITLRCGDAGRWEKQCNQMKAVSQCKICRGQMIQWLM